MRLRFRTVYANVMLSLTWSVERGGSCPFGAVGNELRQPYVACMQFT